jgi:hypothetical protein
MNSGIWNADPHPTPRRRCVGLSLANYGETFTCGTIGNRKVNFRNAFSLA